MITQEDKQAILDRIEVKLRRTRDDIADLEAATQPIAPENSIGRVSRMDAINNKSVNEAALRQARITLKKLEEAEAHLDSPEFGKCRKCGNPMQVARLKFMPESTLCMKCAR